MPGRNRHRWGATDEVTVETIFHTIGSVCVGSAVVKFSLNSGQTRERFLCGSRLIWTPGEQVQHIRTLLVSLHEHAAASGSRSAGRARRRGASGHAPSQMWTAAGPITLIRPFNRPTGLFCLQQRRDITATPNLTPVSMETIHPSEQQQATAKLRPPPIQPIRAPFLVLP